jgi:hypothetical protein
LADRFHSRLFRARLPLFLALLLVGACAQRSPAPQSIPRAAQAVPAPEPAWVPANTSAAFVAARTVSPEAFVDSGAPNAEPPSSSEEAPPEPTCELVAEKPYKLDERVVPAGEVYAAGLEEELARWNLGGNGDPAFVSNRPEFHPGTRVVVDLVSVSGRLPVKPGRDASTGKSRKILSHETLLAQARRNGYWPFRLCFEQGLRSDSKLHGASRLRVRVGRTGRVIDARLLETELTERSAAECLVERAQKLTFSPPPAQRIEATLEIEFWPGDARLPSRGKALGVPVDSNPGRLKPAAIEAALADSQAAVRRCFTEGLAKDSSLWGRLELRIDLDARGSISRLGEHDSRFPDPEVVDCVLRVVRNVGFSAPNEGPLSFIYAWRLGRLPPFPTPVSGPPTEH